MNLRSAPRRLHRWVLALGVAITVGVGVAPQAAHASHAPPIICPGVEVMGIDVLSLDCIP